MWNQLKTVLLLGVLSALLIGIGGALAPNQLGVFVAIALVMNVGSYFFSDKIVLKLYRAQPLADDEAPALHDIVRELSSAAGIPMPRLYVVPGEQPNAFATGRNPTHSAVAVTEGILRILDTRELRGVLAHELSHIKNRDVLVSTVAAVIASAITTIANVMTFGAMFGGYRGSRDDRGGSPLVALLMLIIAPLAATLVQLAISRSRELGADESGAKLSGDPEALATALLKLQQAARVIPPERAEPATANLFIVNPFGALESMARWFSTHPPTEERVRRLREMEQKSRPLHPAHAW